MPRAHMQTSLLAILLLAAPAWAEPPAAPTEPAPAAVANAAAPGPEPAVVAAVAPALLPMGVWLRIGDQHWFSYVDAEAGLSVAGEMDVDGASAHVIARVTGLVEGAHVLTDAERVAATLPVEPAWLTHYGEQPPRGSLWGTWRTDPTLAARFHSAEFPDDLQVVVFAATPQKGRKEAELVWVRVCGCAEGVCRGRMLNEPFGITSLHAGDMIRFRTDVAPDAMLFMLAE